MKLDRSLFLERDFPKLMGLKPDAMAHELDGVLSEEVYERKNAGMYVDLEGDRVLGPDRIGSEDVVLGKKLRKMVVAWSVILQGMFEHDLEQPFGDCVGRVGRRIVDDVAFSTRTRRTPIFW